MATARVLTQPILPEQARGPKLVLALFLALAFMGITDGYVPAVKFDLTYIDLFAALFCAICFLEDRSLPERWMKVFPFFLWGTAFFVWGLLVSPDAANEFDGVVNRLVVIPLVVTAVAAALSSPATFRRLMIFVQVGVLVNAMVCVLQIWDERFIFATARLGADLRAADLKEIGFRAVGFWANQNSAARFFGFGFLLSFLFTWRFNWLTRIAAVVGVFLTASRFGSLMLAFNATALAVFFVATGQFQRIRVAAIVSAVAATVIAVGLVFFPRSDTIERLTGHYEMSDDSLTRLERILDLSDTRARQQSSHRTLTMQGFDRATDSPWYGAGIYSFQRAREGMLSGAHNMYVMVWGETGILGLIGYPLLLIVGIARVMRARLNGAHRLVCLLMWADTVAAGFAAHVLMEGRVMYFKWALMLLLPSLLEERPLPSRVQAPPAAGSGLRLVTE